MPSRATTADARATTTSSPRSARLQRQVAPRPARSRPRPARRRARPPARPGEGAAMTTEAIPQGFVGQPIKRTEDRRLITGKGRYLDDIQMPGLAYMAILRSPYAHANIKSIDIEVAKSMPGVLDVLVGADVPYNPLPMAWPAGGSAGSQNNVSTPRALATDAVEWNGEGVAAVIADSPEQAADAGE